MSGYGGSGYYSDEPPRRRSHRSRRPVREETIIESRQGRNGPPLQQALVRRPRSESSSSIEEIEREFDPESGTHIERRQVVRDRNGNVYNPPRPKSETGYSRNSRNSRPSERRRRDSYDSYDSYDSESESSRSRPPPKRRPSMGEKALAAIGLTGAAGALARRSQSRNRARSRSRRGSRDSSRDSFYEYRSKSEGPNRGRSASRGPTQKNKFEDAAKAAIAAAAVEAWRARREPGSDAGKRILTAAIGAAGIDAAVQQEDRHGNRNAIASAIGGLAANRLINGPRSRSRSRPGEKDITNGTAGTALSVAALAALAGKAIKDHRDRERNMSRSQSRSRVRRNGGGDSYSDDEEYESRHHRKSLSEHFHKPLDKVLDTMGLPPSENHHPKYYVDKHGRRHYSDEEDEGDNRTGIRGGGGDEEPGENYPRLRGGGGSSDSGSSCSTDSYSSEEENKKVKSARKRELITGGLAAVATIHAVANVHKSIKGREQRHKKVLEGKMTPEEARRLKSRAALQDAAAIGLAALGIKGAYSEWKEVREIRGEERKRKLRLQEMREHRQKKLENGEWSNDIWYEKRNKRTQSQSGGGSTNDNGRNRSVDAGPQRSSSTRSRGRYIEDGRGSSRGRSRDARSRRYSDDYYYSSDADEDDAYYDSRHKNRRGYRKSLPPNFSRGNSYYGAPSKNERYASPDAGPRGGRASDAYADDGPIYTDGNPYGGISRSSAQNSPTLASRLPPPPLGYSHAPR